MHFCRIIPSLRPSYSRFNSRDVCNQVYTICLLLLNLAKYVNQIINSNVKENTYQFTDSQHLNKPSFFGLFGRSPMKNMAITYQIIQLLLNCTCVRAMRPHNILILYQPPAIHTYYFLLLDTKRKGCTFLVST